MLVTIETVEDDGDNLLVEVDVVRGSGRDRLLRFELLASAGTWEVVGRPEVLSSR
jgi:hypothetical protein